MYLQELRISNFRCFSEPQTIEFSKGINVLVGENDSGKSAIIDAIRIVMGTTDQGWYRIEPTDFNAERKDVEIAITLKFSDLSKAEQASFLECLTCETVGGKDMPCLYINAVKGRTHLATLVLDTYWYKRNLKSIMPWLCNIASKSPSERDAKRLKCHYVAITRAKGLICLAAPKSSISDKDKTNLIKAGWNITEL